MPLAKLSGNLGLLWEKFRFLQKRNLVLSVRFRSRSERSDSTGRVSAPGRYGKLSIRVRSSHSRIGWIELLPLHDTLAQPEPDFQFDQTLTW